MNIEDRIKQLDEHAKTAARIGLTRDEVSKLVTSAGSDIAQRLADLTKGNPTMGLTVLMSVCHFLLHQQLPENQQNLSAMLLMNVFRLLFDEGDIKLISDALNEKADRIDSIWRRGANSQSAKMLRILAMTISIPIEETC